MLAGVTLFALPAISQNIFTFAGGGPITPSQPYGDGGKAAGASLLGPAQVARDSNGNYYIADNLHIAIRKVSPDGIISTFGGGGGGLYSEGASATGGNLGGSVNGVVIVGNTLFYSDYSFNAVRKIDLTTGKVNTVAGPSTISTAAIFGGYSGDGGPASAAAVHGPGRLQTNGVNLVYFDDGLNHRIRVIDLSTGIINTAVGSGNLTAANGPAAEGINAKAYSFVSLFPPFALDPAGNLYVADEQTRIRKVDVGTNIIHSITGAPSSFNDFALDGALAASSAVRTLALAADGAGNLFFSDIARSICLVRRIDARTGKISTVAGDRVTAPASRGDNGPALKAALLYVTALDFDADGNIFLFDQSEFRIREVPGAGVPFPAPGQTLPSPPFVSSAASIVNGASLSGAVASGAWITIFGQDLSATTRIWGASDFVNGALPVSIDGVSVTINGKAAYIYFVSPSQLNLLAPADSATGPVAVVVTTANGQSSTVMVTKTQTSPAFFQFDPQARKYIAAVFADGTFAGPAGLYGSALTTRPVKPGEIVQLFATGLGATSPAYPDGRLLTQSYTLAVLPVVRIGGVVANVLYAGLVGPGVYQINVALPSLAVGDAAVTIDLGGGVVSAQGVSFLAVGR